MKKVLIVCSVALMLLTAGQIANSFGVFETIFAEDNDLNIAKWHIYVNDYNLNNTDNTFYVDSITYTNNSHVTTNRFAPGVTGTFLLEIDPTDTEVSFQYELSIDLSNSAYSQIHIDSIQGINNTNLVANNGVYSRVFTLSEIAQHKVDTIQVTFSWDNDDDNNDSDSELGLAGGDFAIPINLSFSQYIE